MNHSTHETFSDQVRAIPGGEHLEMCYACGTCVSKCMIQQKLDDRYNPRRLIRKAMLNMETDAYEDITTWLCTACDLCYPACPQEIHISGVIGAIRELAVRNGNSSALKTAVVNTRTCVGCGLCVEVCPYEAISLVDESVPGRGIVTVAKVDHEHCMTCGLCAAGCRSASINLQENFDNEVLVEDLLGWMVLSSPEVVK